ncbi:hypothetical protein Syun_005300 [Stephania yunnanensis]|uniref:NADP-dependent oxidoreductase domain-containing protein n=1 Tax=Stephania yunnanensis TaxID=152371 RepID=A0AAP0L4I7_9MAGN
MAITLNNGFTMPIIGLGLWTLKGQKPVKDIMHTALKTGYRHFDTADKNHYTIPLSVGNSSTPLDEDGVLDIDTTITLESTWRSMEELVSMGLVRSIGIR